MVKQLPGQEITQGCCSTTDEGAAICLVPSTGQSSSCGCRQDEPATLSEYNLEQSRPILQKNTSNWQKLRSGAMFAVACITSPCCTPLIVPLALALLAGTPAAVWLSAHLGWVYGGLTVVSVISLILGVRWLKQKTTIKHFAHTTTQSQLPVMLEPENL